MAQVNDAALKFAMEVFFKGLEMFSGSIKDRKEKIKKLEDQLKNKVDEISNKAKDISNRDESIQELKTKLSDLQKKSEILDGMSQRIECLKEYYFEGEWNTDHTEFNIRKEGENPVLKDNNLITDLNNAFKSAVDGNNNELRDAGGAWTTEQKQKINQAVFKAFTVRMGVGLSGTKESQEYKIKANKWIGKIYEKFKQKVEEKAEAGKHGNKNDNLFSENDLNNLGDEH